MADDAAREAIEQEMNFAKTIPGIFSSYTKSIMTSSCEGKLQFAKFVQAICEMPNLNIDQKIDIINSKQPMNFGVSVPVATVVDMAPVDVSQATLKMSMTVHNTQQQDVESEVKGGADVQATLGWGPFKASVKANASYSRHSSDKRSTDQTSTVDAELVIARQPVPEGLAKILDECNEVVQGAMEINKSLVSRQAAVAADQVQESDPTHPAELPGEGKDDGGAPNN